MNNLNAALKDLGFSKVKMPYATDQKPLDELERLAAIEKRLDIMPDEPVPVEPDPDEPAPDEPEDQGDDDE